MTQACGLDTLIEIPGNITEKLQWDKSSKAINDGILMNSCQHNFMGNVSLHTNTVFLRSHKRK